MVVANHPLISSQTQSTKPSKTIKWIYNQKLFRQPSPWPAAGCSEQKRDPSTATTLQTFSIHSQNLQSCQWHAKKTLKTTEGEVIPQGEGVSGIIILCNADYCNETNIALKATFNRSTPKAILERPDGANFKYIKYYADSKSKTGTHEQFKLAKKAMVKQGGFSKNVRKIRTDSTLSTSQTHSLLQPTLS